ncbi:MAG: hypothetical protein ACFFD2_00305 [Promethearchaeota archaeon]
MTKDIEDMISDLEKKQMDSASLKDEVRKLTQLTRNQKIKIKQLKDKINEQDQKLNDMVESPTDVMELKVIIGRQRAEIEAFEDKVSDRDWRINELESELGMIKKQREELRNKLNEFRKKMVDSNTKIDNYENKITELELELKTTKKFLENAGVTRGDIGELKVKLGQTDARIQEKEKIINKYNEQLKRYENHEIELLTEIEKRDAIVANIQREIKNAVMAKEAEMRSEIMKLQTEINQKKVDYAKLEMKLTEKNVEIKNIQKQLETKETDDTEQKLKFEEVEKVQLHINRLQRMLEMEPLFKIYFILQEVKNITLSELSKAIGQSIGQTRRLAYRLQKEKLIFIEGETAKFPI